MRALRAVLRAARQHALHARYPGAHMTTDEGIAAAARWPRAAGAGLTFRRVTDDDTPFLYRVYASTRVDELAIVPWTHEEKIAFLDMQARAAHRLPAQLRSRRLADHRARRRHDRPALSRSAPALTPHHRHRAPAGTPEPRIWRRTAAGPARRGRRRR